MRRFLGLQLGLLVALVLALLEVDELTTSGKYATAANWTNGKAEHVKPTAASEVKIPEGKEVKVEAGAVCRAFLVEGTWVGASEVKIGDATAPTEAAFSGVALKITASATVTATPSTVAFVGTSASTLGITSSGKTSTFGASFNFEESGKYQLEDNLTLGSTTKVKILGTSKLTLNGHTLKANEAEGGGTSAGTLDMATGTVVVKAWNASELILANTSTSTVEISSGATTGSFSGASKAYGTVVFVNREVTVTGSNSYVVMRVKNKNAVEKGVKVTQATTQTVTTLSVSEGTVGEPCRIESTEAGKPWTLALSADQEVAGHLAIKDCHVTGGTLYLPEGVSVSGNENVVIGSKPGGASASPAMLV